MSEDTTRLIETLLIKTSQERGDLHWAKIYAHSPEILGAKEKQEIKQLADRWGVTILGEQPAFSHRSHPGRGIHGGTQ